MTVITKNALAVKKMEIIRMPLGDEHGVREQDNYEICHIQELGPNHPSKSFVCLSFLFMMFILVFTSAIIMFRQNENKSSSSSTHRYQGYCTVSLNDFKDPSWPGLELQVIPYHEEHDFQFVSTLNDKSTKELVNALREELDIEESVENIGVFDNGRHVNFIHDFNSNLTGIVDSDRCFVMDLVPDLVMEPEVFAAGLVRGEEFDVSRVRSPLRAVLPALDDLASARLASACETRPAYKLARDDDSVILRKRSADDPPHDYIHFSGKHVQEIKIENLQEILDYENKNKNV